MKLFLKSALRCHYKVEWDNAELVGTHFYDIDNSFLDNTSSPLHGVYEVQSGNASLPLGNDLNPVEAGIRIMDSIEEFIVSLSKFTGLSLDDSLIREVEGLTALYITILGCKDTMSIASSIFLYVRSHFGKSITHEVASYIKDALYPMVVQSSGESPNWMTLLRDARHDWTLCKGNKLFDHFSKLLGLLVTLGLCKASNVTFRLKDFKFLEPDLTILHGSAVDVIDAVFSTVTFFVESLYSCFKEKSFRPLWGNSSVTMELDEEYSTIMGWWELVKNGNLERITREQGNEIKVAEFDRRLEALACKLRNLMGALKGFDKKLVADKFQKLLNVKNDYITMKISSGLRKAPFAIELFGASSQGKSTVGDQLVDAILMSCNAPLGKEFRASFNPGDEYMSNWTTDKTVLLFDDVSNEKSQFVQRPPTRAIIDVVNNEPCYANKAELDAKGKVFIEPLVVLVTTNVKDLDSFTYSNCPYSVQRRMNMVVTVEAKEEFQIIIDGKPQGVDASKIRSAYTVDGVYTPPAFDDIWELTIERPVQPEALGLVAGYQPVTWRGKVMKKIPMRLVVQYAIEKYHEHERNQEALMDSMLSREGKLSLCGFKDCRQIKGYCDLHDNEVHFGEEFASALGTAGSVISGRIMSDVESHSRLAERAATMALLGTATAFASRWDWLKIIPTPIVHSTPFLNILAYCNIKYIKHLYIMHSIISWTLCMSISIFSWHNLCFGPLFCLCLTIYELIIALILQKYMRNDVLRIYRNQLVSRNTISATWQQARDKHIAGICSACALIGLVYAMAKVYKRYRALNVQGSLEPKAWSEIVERDAEENVWTTIEKRELPITPLSKTVSSHVLEGAVEKNLVYATIIVGDRVLSANALFIRSNVVVLPSHYFISDVLDITFRKERPDACGGKFAARISLSSSYRVPNSDLVLCYCATGGSFRDLTKHFPMQHLGVHSFTLAYRQKDGEVMKAKGYAHPCDVQATDDKISYNYRGGIYDLSMNTFKGLCGAVMTSDTVGCVISGFHLGGRDGTLKGCYGVLTQGDLEAGYQALRQIEGVLLTGSAEQFEVQVFGEGTVDISAEPHQKSCLRFMPKNSQVVYYGGCKGFTTSHTSVRVTPISEHILDICGVPNKWGPPKMKPEWFAWQKCMENISVPALPYPHDLLAIAIRDYKSALEPIFKRDFWNKTCPMEDMDNVNGIPGLKFMDAIKSQTAIGYPLTGAKSKHMEMLDSTSRHQHCKTFKSYVWEHISAVEMKYERGERAFEVAKAQKKDEIIGLAKEKCRIFYGNPVALTFLIRKYYLPIIRVLQMNPLTSECAVGINCHGPEWEELHNHVFKYGSDRLIGGDYGKYDQKLPSQLIIASFRILIDMAKLCEYTERDIRIMEAMAGDVVFALIAFNGDLIGLTEGTHISGNSLTVDINGIAGSLNCRCYFYTLFPPVSYESRIPFRDAVALVTYGDDNIGSVKEGYEDFNIKGFSEFLDTYGQVYTMPDKEQKLRKFLDFNEFEFLKRKSVYHPRLGVHIGALDEKSIFKSLHCYVREKKSPITSDEACAQNISTAIREWFNHGESLYEIRRSQMIDVAKRAQIYHMCEGLNLTYHDRTQEWTERYILKTKKPEKPAVFDLE